MSDNTHDDGRQSGPPRRYTLAEADIEVVAREVRIVGGSALDTTDAPLIYQNPRDYFDYADQYHPPPPNYDINDYRNDGNPSDGDAYNVP